MKLQAPKNPNYAAVIVRISNLVPLAGCDNVVGTNLYGYQAIVGKDTKIGDVGLFFPAESQLSHEYCQENNLYRHETLNSDPTKKGYIEDSRRVKAIKFRGHTSSCLFMPLSSLYQFAFEEDINSLKEGDTFDAIDETPICKKYEVLINGRIKGPANMPKQPQRIEKLYLPEHIDTENYWRNKELIHRDTEVIVTQKIHGTSIRIGHTIVSRPLSLRDRIAKRLGVQVRDTEYDVIFGSRKCIKDSRNPNQIHYYEAVDSKDLWTTEGEKIASMVPENYLLYGELVGWTPNGKAIQEGYTYDLEKGFCRLYIYRVAVINAKGLTVDLSWDQVKRFCNERSIQHVPELWRGRHSDFVPEKWIDKVLQVTYAQALPLSDKDTVDEGVVVRAEGLTPVLLKAKSPKFFEHETKMLDKEAVDIEATEQV